MLIPIFTYANPFSIQQYKPPPILYYVGTTTTSSCIDSHMYDIDQGSPKI
jgi:hypothetical protein